MKDISYIQYTVDSSRGSIIRVKEGYPGPRGESGYTPVRGVDYWTSADQQYIINEVLSQIPDYEEVSF